MGSQVALNPLPTFCEWYETTNSIGKCRCQLLQLVVIHTSLSKCLQFILCFPQPTIGQNSSLNPTYSCELDKVLHTIPKIEVNIFNITKS